MAKKRDYKEEYRRRIKSGLKRGLSKIQARGHAKMVEQRASAIMRVLMSLFFLITTQLQGLPIDFDNVPVPISECLQSKAARLEISRRMNPFYLRGDFNGDGRLDYAVLVQERKSEKLGIAFCFAGANKKPHIVGAGIAIALKGSITGNDFSSFDVWGIAESWAIKPKRDALYLARTESGSGVLIWNGKRMVWRQLIIKLSSARFLNPR